jgi:hypothetical protein
MQTQTLQMPIFASAIPHHGPPSNLTRASIPVALPLVPLGRVAACLRGCARIRGCRRGPIPACHWLLLRHSLPVPATDTASGRYITMATASNKKPQRSSLKGLPHTGTSGIGPLPGRRPALPNCIAPFRQLMRTCGPITKQRSEGRNCEHMAYNQSKRPAASCRATRHQPHSAFGTHPCADWP